MTEMLERVARAIHDQRCISAGPCPSWEDAEEATRKIARELAAAAIRALREPTEAMTHAYPGFSVERPSTKEDAYRAMIDAALK